MTEATKVLRALNDNIRGAANAGNIEDLFVMIEKRRQFLDSILPAQAKKDPALLTALEDAVHDNTGLLQALETIVKNARKRGSYTNQARCSYTITQTIP